MKIYKLATMLALLMIMSSCTSILVRTTGSDGIQEDPTQRTAGARVEDESIETKIIVNLKSQEPAFRETNVSAVSHNGVVLLIGQVPDQQLKNRATEIAATASAKIKRIHNELEVLGNTTYLSRGNDTWISTKVRTLMLTNNDVPADQVRVITENGSVFLMGIISEREGDTAANIARNVSGVTKVVKVFEYLN